MVCAKRFWRIQVPILKRPMGEEVCEQKIFHYHTGLLVAVDLHWVCANWTYCWFPL